MDWLTAFFVVDKLHRSQKLRANQMHDWIFAVDLEIYLLLCSGVGVVIRGLLWAWLEGFGQAGRLLGSHCSCGSPQKVFLISPDATGLTVGLGATRPAEP